MFQKNEREKISFLHLIFSKTRPRINAEPEARTESTAKITPLKPQKGAFHFCNFNYKNIWTLNFRILNFRKKSFGPIFNIFWIDR